MKRLLFLVLPGLLLLSCVKNLDDYNIDQKKPTTAPAATLFTGAIKNMADVLASSNVNTNVFRLYVQQWTTTEYLDEPRYNLTARTIPQALWQALYRDVLMDLKEAKRLIEADPLLAADEKANQLAQIEIIEVYAWSVLVNSFGNIPYSEALNVDNALPKYDDAATVYADLVVRLDAALASLKPGADDFGEADLLYNYGSVTTEVAGWIKFGNSLKLKLGMILADSDVSTARRMVQEAAPNVFTSNADNARFPYLSAIPNNNPISNSLNPSLTGRQDFVGAEAFINKLNSVNDPRRPFYFTAVNGEYIGGKYGFANTYINFSTASPKVVALNFESLLLDYSEVEFLLAEAVERGFTVPGTAAEHYNNGVSASITYWGGTETQANTYLAQPGVAYLNPASGGSWREKIGTQKWIALYNRGYDAWTEWRRLDFPRLSPPSAAEGAPAGLVIPTRLIYPVNEQTLNTVNNQAAADAMGGDAVSSKLFWDIN